MLFDPFRMASTVFEVILAILFICYVFIAAMLVKYFYLLAPCAWSCIYSTIFRLSISYYRL